MKAERLGAPNRGGRENPVVADALGGQLVEVGRVNPLPAEAPEVQVAVVGDQPEDVGLVLGRANRGEDEQENNGEESFHRELSVDGGGINGKRHQASGLPLVACFKALMRRFRVGIRRSDACLEVKPMKQLVLPFALLSLCFSLFGEKLQRGHRIHR